MTKIEKYKKIISGVIVFVVLFSSLSPIFANKVNAQLFVPVWDPGNFSVNAVSSKNSVLLFVKEYGLDAVLYSMANLLIQRISASTVEWINRGFKGSPAFITNPESYFLDLGDKIAGQYIFENPNLNFLCGPISARIRIALSQNYVGDNQRWQCRLKDAAGNMEDFLGDFEKGGWDKFFVMTQDPLQNPLGAYIQAEGELFQKIANKTDEKNKELSFGKGFFSSKDCIQYDTSTAGVDATMPAGTAITGVDPTTGELIYSEEAVTQRLPDIPPRCIKERINTPGSVISEQLNKTLGIGGERLAAADEINEIMSALLSQLVGQIVGGVGKGLRGLSSPSPANENKIFTEQLSVPSNNDVVDDYFYSATSTQNVRDVLGVPPYDPYVCRNNPSLPECLPPPEPVDSQPIIPTCNPAVETCPGTP